MKFAGKHTEGRDLMTVGKKIGVNVGVFLEWREIASKAKMWNNIHLSIKEESLMFDSPATGLTGSPV